MHLRRVSADDAITIGWVNFNLLLLHILMLLLTRYGNLNIGTGDTIVLEHKAGRPIGRAVIKVRGTRIAVEKHSAKIANARIIARIIARNPRHRIRWTAPSQQRHHDPGAVTLSAVADT